ncbi:MAG: crossover junction endodeoxyribonuclease RuvC [Limnochordia bacterium]|nr:crossover junction endodeoxyribonuclease RuvC [Limnochordia bacterium]MDD2629532.1 crossover junction endodeoxyribonuclease RuvC [Limnochordia bacterium]MDD4517904.1 crossover junction endodeoxyribonuclease RuvC [Limnochordia bacterium]
MTTILGIDPGTATTGYGIICAKGNKLQVIHYGAILTSPKHDMPHRLQQIYAEISALIAQYRPKAMAIEQLFFNKNITTALSVGQARGVGILAGAHGGLAIAEYTPLQVKQTVTGEGRADKNQVAFMVKLLLGLQEIPKPDDVTDALAIAICHAHTNPVLARLAGGD